MTGIQVFVVVLSVLNVGLAVVMADPMTWRTHRWGPQLRIMGCGVLASIGGLLGWSGLDLEFAVCAQFAVLAVLLHCLERSRLAPSDAWRESRVAEGETHAQ